MGLSMALYLNCCRLLARLLIWLVVRAFNHGLPPHSVLERNRRGCIVTIWPDGDATPPHRLEGLHMSMGPHLILWLLLMMPSGSSESSGNPGVARGEKATRSTSSTLGGNGWH